MAGFLVNFASEDAPVLHTVVEVEVKKSIEEFIIAIFNFIVVYLVSMTCGYSAVTLPDLAVVLLARGVTERFSVRWLVWVQKRGVQRLVERFNGLDRGAQSGVSWVVIRVILMPLGDGVGIRAKAERSVL